MIFLMFYGCAFVSEKNLDDRISVMSTQDEDGDGSSWNDDCDDNDPSI